MGEEIAKRGLARDLGEFREVIVFRQKHSHTLNTHHALSLTILDLPFQ
jgi:hypothetical protein